MSELKDVGAAMLRNMQVTKGYRDLEMKRCDLQNREPVAIEKCKKMLNLPKLGEVNHMTT